MRENESQDRLQAGQLEENIPSHVPQASNLQSRNNPISNEPERTQPQYPKLQKMSSQRDHCVEQPVGPVHHGPEKAKVCELICILVDLVDKDRKMQLRNLYYKFKVGLHIHAMTCLSLSSRTLNTLLFVSYLFADKRNNSRKAHSLCEACCRCETNEIGT